MTKPPEAQKLPTADEFIIRGTIKASESRFGGRSSEMRVDSADEVRVSRADSADG